MKRDMPTVKSLTYDSVEQLMREALDAYDRRTARDCVRTLEWLRHGAAFGVRSRAAERVARVMRDAITRAGC